MTGPYPSVVVRVVSALLSPFIVMYGLYIIAHGHYGPGGGFAGGVFAAVGVVLPRLTLPESLSYRLVPAAVGPFAGAVGMLLFLTIAAAPLLVGGAFLDYGALEVPGMSEARVRYLGILVVEAGVGFSVFGSMVMIFDVLAGRSGR